MLESWIIALPTSHDHIVCLNITLSIPLSSKSYWWWFFDFGIVTGMLTFAGNNTTFTATAFTFGDFFFGWVGKATHLSIGSNTFGKLLLLIVGNTSASFFCSPTSTFVTFLTKVEALDGYLARLQRQYLCVTVHSPLSVLRQTYKL